MKFSYAGHTIPIQVFCEPCTWCQLTAHIDVMITVNITCFQECPVEAANTDFFSVSICGSYNLFVSD